ncbi:MAG: AbrB/MazE/SpoVT family DNA-binding domain-containing protein [Candidatus Omnitrophota bacterium]
MITETTTKLSSKGQIVIPEILREQLKLKTGDVFLVYGKDNTIVLKTATPPTIDEFDAIVEETQNYARKAGLKPSDITSAIKKVRAKA